MFIYKSTTDPDATLMKKTLRGAAYLSYQFHVSVDSENRFITGVRTTTGETNECRYLPEIIREQKEKYGFEVKDITADKGHYSTAPMVVSHVGALKVCKASGSGV